MANRKSRRSKNRQNRRSISLGLDNEPPGGEPISDILASVKTPEEAAEAFAAMDPVHRWNTLVYGMGETINALYSMLNMMLVDAAADNTLVDLNEYIDIIEQWISFSTEYEGLAQTVSTIIHSQQPVATTQWDGMRWGGPQTPERIIGLAKRADSANERAPYLDLVTDPQVQESTRKHCPICDGWTVKRADGTRTKHCYRHLNADDLADVKRERHLARQLPCSSCGASATQLCVDMYGKSVTTVCNPRLVAVHNEAPPPNGLHNHDDLEPPLTEPPMTDLDSIHEPEDE